MKTRLLKKFRKRYRWQFVNGVICVTDLKENDKFIASSILRFMQRALPELGHLYSSVDWQIKKGKIYRNRCVNEFINENNQPHD